MAPRQAMTMANQQVITQAGAVKPAKSTKRAAYSPAEFAASCGRHPGWAYRLLYGGKIRALTDLGRILIPASELERVLATATPYNPKPRPLKARVSREAPTGEEESEGMVATPFPHAPAANTCDTIGSNE